MKSLGNILNILGLPALPSQSSEAIAALIWAREVLQNHLSSAYRVRNSNGIEELKDISIGGVKQWIHIRGRNRSNPILLYLHGGPGESMIGNMDMTQRPWEDYFTVVQWDQRQAGKSYYPADDQHNPLTLQQHIEDAEALISYLRDYLKQEKLFLLGHSWGSVLGMHLVKRHPDWLYAYIGVGQVVNMAEGEYALYQRILHHAHKANEAEVIARLKDIPPLRDMEPARRAEVFVENCTWARQQLSRLAGEIGMHHMPVADVIEMFNLDRLISPHITATDLWNGITGDLPAVVRPPYTNMAKEFMDVDLPQQIGCSFDIPVVFFSGRHDYQTPVTLSDQWFNDISAPDKALIHFEESSHMIVNEEPGRVLNALVNQVLPYAQSPEENI